MEEKQKRMKDLTPEERREIWEDFRAQLEEYEKVGGMSLSAE